MRTCNTFRLYEPENCICQHPPTHPYIFRLIQSESGRMVQFKRFLQAGFEFLTAVLMTVQFLWIMTIRYQCLGGAWYLHLQDLFKSHEGGGSRFLSYVRTYLLIYTASYPRRPTGISSVYDSVLLALFLHLVCGPVTESIKVSPLSSSRELARSVFHSSGIWR